jgi:hypothetical protein
MRAAIALLVLTLAPAPLACSKRDAGAADAATQASAASAPDLSPPLASASASAMTDARFPARVVALAWETKVYEKPNDKSKVLGYLRAGAVVAASKASAGTCGSGGWYPVAPSGFVCTDAANATTDASHPLARMLARRPDASERLPYMYGVVRKPGPIYGRLPTRAEAAAAEPELEPRIKEWLASTNEDGAQFRTDYWMRGKGRPAPSPLALWDAKTNEDIPFYLEGGAFPFDVSGMNKGTTLIIGATKNHNGLALVDTAVFEGRRFGITTDLTIFPVDRMRPIEGSAYHGLRIPDEADFPFAIIRRDGAELYRYENHHLTKAKDVARRTVIKLTGHKSFFHGRMHFQTADGLYVPDSHASFFDRPKKMPKWAKGTSGHWIDVSIGKQTLVAYEGERAVYATVVSTGEAGLEDPETSKSTKTGVFRIHTKHVTTTMASDVVGEEFELRDIPYVQYFEAGYALHAAYWHDDFGTPRSHGCINLSPEDARWLFMWTEPQVPQGWHSVRKALTGSTVFVHP